MEKLFSCDPQSACHIQSAHIWNYDTQMNKSPALQVQYRQRGWKMLRKSLPLLKRLEKRSEEETTL